MAVIIKKRVKRVPQPDPLVSAPADDPHPTLLNLVRALAREDAREDHRRWLKQQSNACDE